MIQKMVWGRVQEFGVSTYVIILPFSVFCKHRGGRSNGLHTKILNLTHSHIVYMRKYAKWSPDSQNSQYSHFTIPVSGFQHDICRKDGVVGNIFPSWLSQRSFEGSKQRERRFSSFECCHFGSSKNRNKDASLFLKGWNEIRYILRSTMGCQPTTSFS